jgi:branched-chain amino acid transport system substrate-binding protein
MAAPGRCGTPAPALLIWGLAALTALTAACAGGAPAPEPAGPAESPPVTLVPGVLETGEETRAAELVARARVALAGARYDEALVAAGTVVERLPAARVSGEALEIVARAAAGAEDWERAGEAAARLVTLLPPGDERLGSMRLLEARSLYAAGRDRDVLDRLLATPPFGSERVDEVRDLVREASSRLTLAELDEVVDEAPPAHALLAPILVARATGLLLAGRRDEAAEQARAALELGAVDPDAEQATNLAQGRLPPGVGPFRLGAMLPMTGSPALRSFAAGVRDGMEAALVAGGLDGIVELEVLDTGGDAVAVTSLMRSAEDRNVLGVVGPLRDDALAAAAMARGGGLALVSPTASTVPAAANGGVYSLGATDPGAPAGLAAWAARAGIHSVAVLHGSRGISAEEARVFADAFSAAGGRVVRMLVYEPGVTYFQEQLRTVHGLHPEALFLPALPEDVQALAPQVTFFGLDTLGVQILGTSGWADPATLATVSRRHLDGVVVATPRRPGRDSEGFRRFVDAYESHFRRTLVDPTVPALGYDAAALLLEALRSGARTPAAVRGALEGVADFSGATGVLSVRDGRVVREHQVVCLWGGELSPLGPSERPEALFRPHTPDPETGEVAEGPGRPAGFRCPGVGEPPPGS